VWEAATKGKKHVMLYNIHQKYKRDFLCIGK